MAPELTELTDPSPGDEARQVNLQMIINVHDLLSVVAEDGAGHKAKADSYRQTLASLKPAETATPATPAAPMPPAPMPENK